MGGVRLVAPSFAVRLAPRLFDAERNLVTAWLDHAMPDQLDAVIIQNTLRGRVLDQLIECLCHAVFVRLRGVVRNRRDEVDRSEVGIPARSRSVFYRHSDPFR
jgi:hypothetical protein